MHVNISMRRMTLLGISGALNEAFCAADSGMFLADSEVRTARAGSITSLAVSFYVTSVFVTFPT